MRYGEGSAHDLTYSHYKRAKPTQTDPEDGTNADPSLLGGSTSKTYNPRMDGNFWKRTDSGHEWTQSSSSSAHWKPRMKHEKYYSSVAGDTSEASTAMNALGPRFPLQAIGSPYTPSVPLTLWTLLNCLIVGHSPGFDCIGPQGATKNIGLGRT